MNKQIELHALAKQELQRCLALQELCDTASLPKGSLIERNGNYYRCVRENGRQFHVQLTVRDNDLLIDLRKRRFCKTENKIINRHIQCLKDFLENDVLYDPVAIQHSLPEIYRDFPLNSFLLEGDIEPEVWRTENYVRSNFHPEALCHVTPGGLNVRSKSEAMIASRLEQLNIPFRYEPIIEFNGVIRAPDFEILLEKRRMLIYWEHLGLVENTSYIMSALDKLMLYGENGLTLGKDIFITYETRTEPLTFQKIDNTIDKILALDHFEW